MPSGLRGRCLSACVSHNDRYIVRYIAEHFGGRHMFGRHAYWARGGCRPSFGSWAPRSRFFGPGEVRLAILSLLSDGPRHGYELMKLLAQRSGGIYRASAGTIYPTLQQLEDEGLIAAEAQEGKRVFRITEEGRRELRLEDDVVERIWRRAKMWNE